MGGGRQTSPLSARHIAGVTLAEKTGPSAPETDTYGFFTLFTVPISRHPESAYAPQGLWRALAAAADGIDSWARCAKIAPLHATGRSPCGWRWRRVRWPSRPGRPRRVSVLLGLASGLSWGVADFFGGLQSRKVPALAVSLWSQLAGGITLLAVLGV